MSDRFDQIRNILPENPIFTDEVFFFNQTISLIKYQKKQKEEELMNLMGDYDAPKDKPQEDQEVDENYYPHLKRFLNLNFVVDHAVYTDRTLALIPPFVLPHYQIDVSTGTFKPILYLSDFWVL